MSAVNNISPDFPAPVFCFVLMQTPNPKYPQDLLSLTSTLGCIYPFETKINVHRFIFSLCISLAMFVNLLIIINMGQGPLFRALVFTQTLAISHFLSSILFFARQEKTLDPESMAHQLVFLQVYLLLELNPYSIAGFSCILVSAITTNTVTEYSFGHIL